MLASAVTNGLRAAVMFTFGLWCGAGTRRGHPLEYLRVALVLWFALAVVDLLYQLFFVAEARPKLRVIERD